MDVALANYEFPPHCGGGGAFTQSLSEELRARGHGVELVVDDRDAPTSDLSRACSFPLRSLPAAVRASARVDVLNAHFAVPTSTALPPLRTLTGTPLVVNLMGADVYDPTRYERIRPLLDATLRYWIARAADALVVPSQDMYDRLPTTLQSQTRIIPYFVDVERYQSGPPDPDPPTRLLTVARLVERKRLPLALDTVAALRERGHAVEYSIVGEGPELEGLRAAAAKRGIADAVTFHGYVSDRVLAKLYRRHDVFILPSTHEAFGIAAVEGLASGLPLVATDSGGHAELATEECGRVCRADADALADAVAEIGEKLPSHARAARQHAVRNYSPPAVLPEYERLYSNVIA